MGTAVPSRSSFLCSCFCATVEWLGQELYGLENLHCWLTGPSQQSLLIPDLEVHCISYLSPRCGKTPNRGHLRGKGLLGLTFEERMQAGRHSGRSVRELVTVHLYSGSRKRGMLVSGSCLLLVQPKTPVHEISLLTFWVGLSSPPSLEMPSQIHPEVSPGLVWRISHQSNPAGKQNKPPWGHGVEGRGTIAKVAHVFPMQ